MTSEGMGLIEHAAEMGVRPTGGDPLARPDVYDLVAAAARSGMHVGFSPSVTARLRPSALFRAAEARGGHRAPEPRRRPGHHPRPLPRVAGSFQRTLAALEAAAGLPVRLQVGTTVSRQTVDTLADVACLLDGLADAWTLFFLVSTGRATAPDLLSPEEHERVLRWLATEPLPFPVRTVEASAFRRVLAELGRPVSPGVGDGNWLLLRIPASASYPIA